LNDSTFLDFTSAAETSAANERHFSALRRGEASTDRIASVRISAATLPLKGAISDAKVLTGRQKPLRDVAFLFAEIRTEAGLEGVGFSYSKRAGGAGQFAHAREVAPELIGEDPSDIQRIWTKLVWAGASVGRSGLAVQAVAAFDIALWDLKAKRAGLPLAKLLGAHRDSVACYNTSGGFLSSSIEEVIENAHATAESGIGGVKIKVGQPDTKLDLRRVAAVKEAIGDRIDLMVDANQQWNRSTAVRMGRAFEEFDLTWIEEPVRRWDAEGLAAVSRGVRASVATMENLTGLEQYRPLIAAQAVDIVQTAVVWGVSHFLRVSALAHAHDLPVSPIGGTPVPLLHAATSVPNHRASELQDLHPPLGLSLDLYVEDGAFILGDSPGLGITIDEQAINSFTRRPNAGAAAGPNIRPEHAGRRLLAVTGGSPRR